MRTPSRLRTVSLLGAVAIAALAGCKTDAPPIGLVSGLVTHNGKPIPNLTVNFFPTNGRPSNGQTDTSGHYTLRWDAEHDGAEVGTHKVTVAYVPGSQAPQAKAEPGKPAPGPEAAATPEELKVILEKYGNPDKSPLTFEVKSGSQTIDLKLD
jgi:hypothetical protein